MRPILRLTMRLSSVRDGADRYWLRRSVYSAYGLRMPTTLNIALSSATASIALVGALLALTGSAEPQQRAPLSLIFGLFAVITSLPLTIEFGADWYPLHITTILPVLLAVAPVTYRYVKARTQPGQTLRFGRIDYLLPTAGIVVVIGYWVLSPAARDMMLVDGELPEGWLAPTLAIATLALLAVWLCASLVYLTRTISTLRRYRAQLKQHYSNVANLELRWIDWFMLLLVTLWVASAVSIITDNIGFAPLFPASILYPLTSLLLLMLMIFASAPIADQQVALGDYTDQDEHSDQNLSPEKYAKSALSDEQARGIAARIEAAMQEDRLFLDPNLSLKKLAQHAHALPIMVSQTLNDELGLTFYDYIAHWRVEDAKARLIDTKDSILQISLDVGFNSRSTFYKAFKKQTGVPPKAFRAGQTDTA